jgi:hypothetical protein
MPLRIITLNAILDFLHKERKMKFRAGEAQITE